jgi:K+-sensing histidine kinase KdpD
MMTNLKVDSEERRINTLSSYEIQYGETETDFDDVTLLASQICNTQISYISFIDDKTQWFKSTINFDALQCPREISICSYALETPNSITEIEDVRDDARFYNNPAVIGPSKIVFYASAPLIAPNGMAIGTVCVLDKKPHKLTSKQKKALIALSKQVINVLELRKQKHIIEQNIKVLAAKNKALEGFTDSSINNMQSPLSTITLISDLTRKRYKGELGEKDKEYLGIVESASKKMKYMLNNIKTFHENLDLITHSKEFFFISDLFEEVLIEIHDKSGEIKYSNQITKIHANKAVIKTILKGLILNSISRQKESNYSLFLDFNLKKEAYLFTLTDSGEMLNHLNEDDIYFDFIAMNNILAESLNGNLILNYTSEGKNIISLFVSK